MPGLDPRLSGDDVSGCFTVAEIQYGDHLSPPRGGKRSASGSLKSEKPAKLGNLRARRAKAVGRMSAVAIADGHRAKQHLLRRHVHERPHHLMDARPGFLRAGIEAVTAGEKHQRMDVAAEVGPLAGPELALDADEKRHRGVKEFEIAVVLGEPAGSVVAADAERAVELHAVIIAAPSIGLPQR